MGEISKGGPKPSNPQKRYEHIQKTEKAPYLSYRIKKNRKVYNGRLYVMQADQKLSGTPKLVLLIGRSPDSCTVMRAQYMRVSVSLNICTFYRTMIRKKNEATSER
jgi:hypothetical protein